ncbi:MAG TPA: lysophospholipid acyltransferase family protein [Polyangia bacterium]|nr:lysophospholipid acyltransferase family protein [Polyangia bacterium]
MAGKQILGDDPFGTGDAPAPAAKKKKEKKIESETAAENAAESASAAASEVAHEAAPEADEDRDALDSDGENGTYAPAAAQPPSEYGPSIDQPPVAKHSGLVDEIKHLEHSVRERILPARSGEHGGERQRLPLEFLWKRWRELAMRDRSDVVDEFGRDPNVAARVEPLLDFLYRQYFRVSTRGLGHIPDDGRGLIVANHSGTLPYDGAMIMYGIRHEHSAHREVRPLVEDFVFHFPYLGTLMNRIGGVRAAPENAERLLNQDQLVAVFPEGIKGIGKLFRERYQLQRFGRGGFIKLALKCDAPIIPTAVVGAEEIHPMLSKITWLARSVGIPYLPVTPTFPLLGPIGLLPLPTKWFIAFGEPLYYNAEYGPEGANDRILVNKLAEQVRNKIQSMIDSLLKERRSILFG